MKTLIIAEAGVNHNGNKSIAFELIDTAAEAGVDIVKFQSFNADRQVTLTAEKARYQKNLTCKSETHYQMLKRLQLSPKMHYELINHCDKKNVRFLSTAFDIESVQFLASLNQNLFKIPSGEITNLPYLRCIGKLHKKIILSTGMASLSEIETAIGVLEKCGTSRKKITLLHCTSEYPAPMKEVNLRAMQTMRSTFGVNVGYSDHTLGIEIAIAAVAMGATIIEKHFTLNKNLPGPDHKASLEPDELRALVRSIRNIEVCLGDGIKKVTPSENKNKKVARKSLVANGPIKKGELFTIDNVTAKRPEVGISPMLWDMVIGRHAKRNFQNDELIEL